MKFRSNLSPERLRELLVYDQTTGCFTWKKARGNAREGEVAGTNNSGYVQIMIDKVPYMAHRLAWLYMKGKWPEADLDHKDLNRSNNCFSNLRPGNGQNNQNQPVRKTSKSGLKGAIPMRDKWQAQICSAGVRHHLGTFNSPEEAHRAYVAASIKHHGEYRRS